MDKSDFAAFMGDKRYLDKMRWHTAVEECLLVPFTKASKRYGIKCKMAMTKELFDQLYPYAEEAVDNIEFMDRFEDLVKGFKKASIWAKTDFCEFDIKVPTKVKEKFNFTEISTWRRKRDKTVTVFATGLPDDTGKMALVFGLLSTVGGIYVG